MKKIVLVIGLLIILPTIIFPQSGWNRQYSGTTNELRNTFFTDSLHGVVVGLNGTILKTSDGGNYWSRKNSGTTDHLKFVFFINEQVGTIVGAGGIILRTEDGGDTWIQQISPIGYLESVSFYDENNGIAVGSSSIIRTTNGGQIWEILSTGVLKSNLYRVHYFDYNNIIIFYDWYSSSPYSGVYKTTDAGITWTDQMLINHLPHGQLNDTKFINSSTGYVLGVRGATGVMNGYFFRTTDSGTSWQLISDFVPAYNSFSFIDINNGTAVGYGGKIYITTDGGITWNPQFVDGSTALYSVFFANNNYGTIVGYGGLIYRTITGGIKLPSTNWFTTNSGTTINLLSVYFINSNKGVCVGSPYIFDGIILRTSDGGNNWTSFYGGDEFYGFAPHDVWFGDSNNGSMVGQSYNGSPLGRMANSTDGGLTWSIYLFDQSLNEMKYRIARGIQYLDNLRRIIVAQYGRILYTVDGGVTWTKSDSVTAWDLNDLSFPNDEVGYVVGDRGTILKSTDSGISWSIVPINRSDNLYGVYFTDSDNGTVVGMYGKILKTTDGGMSWIEQEIGTYNHLDKVVFDNHNNGIIVGEFGTILKTIDGGETWEFEESGTSLNLNAVSITNSLAVTVGDFGIILRKVDPTLDNNEGIIEIPNNFNLSQNYPNPFNPSTKISWQSPVSGWQTLKVYDVLGNEVATLVDEYKAAGSYEIEFYPASSIKHPASGIYFYQLKADDYLETKKMILLK